MIRLVLVFLMLCLGGFAGAQEMRVERSKELITVDGRSVYLHTVAPKQTLFSICKAYGVSVEEVKVLNGKRDNALSVGEVLRVPRVEPLKRVDGKYYYHRMRAKETLYSLSRKFGIKLKRILKENPEYDVSRPIAEGAVVRLPLRQIDRGVLEAELAWLDRQERESAQAAREEEGAFPPARDSLEGMVRQEVGDTSYIVPEVAVEKGHVRVAVLLPLYVKDNKLPVVPEEIPVDSSGVNVRNERWRLNERTIPFLQFYQGVMMAADSLKHRGYTVELHVYDTDGGADSMEVLAGELNRLSPDLIIGPVYANAFKAVAGRLTNKVTPMIYPLSSRGEALSGFPNFVQMNISTGALLEEMADWVVENCRGAHILNIIPDGGSRGEERGLSDLVRARLGGDSLPEMTDYQWLKQMHVDTVRQVMRPDVENVILFPTVNEAAASRTLPVLSALADHFKITVIGFPEWLKFTSLDEEMFYKLNVKMMVNSYVDYQGEEARAFSAKYREYFHAEPSSLANRAFDMALYFIPLVEEERGNTMNMLRDTNVEGMFTRFLFQPLSEFGGLENRGLYLVNYNSGYGIVVVPI